MENDFLEHSHPHVDKHSDVGKLRENALSLASLSGMSISSVGPVFSMAAAMGPMIAIAGYGAPLATGLALIPILISSVTYRHLNRHIPNAGAGYGWTLSALGPVMGLIQGWFMLLAYFFSLLAIIIPAGTYTLALFDPSLLTSRPAVAIAGSAWALFAAIPLIWGIKPTARFTVVFLAVEIGIITLFSVLGFEHLAAGNFHTHLDLAKLLPGRTFGLSELLPAAIIAFTILDGWEVDSHAAEESRSKRVNPGTAGLIGLVVVTLLYVLAFTLLFATSPLKQLVGHQLNVLSFFASLVSSPAWSKVMILGILASTASGLWLTHLILNRTMFAMSRDAIIPSKLGRVHPHFQTPWKLVLVVTGAEVAVTLGLTISPSVSSFFSIVLQSAGLFLGIVFLLSNISALIYFRKISFGQVHHFLLLVVLPTIAIAGMSALVASYLFEEGRTAILLMVGSLIGAALFVLQAKMRGLGMLQAQAQRATNFKVTVLPNQAETEDLDGLARLPLS